VRPPRSACGRRESPAPPFPHEHHVPIIG
jgi:hypothetical protein